MKKRWISLLMTGVMLGTLCTGCGGKSNTADTSKLSSVKEKQDKNATIKLTLWGTADDEKLLQTMIDSFKEKYKGEAQFEITFTAVEESVCKDTATNDVENCADVFSFADDQLAAFAASGILKPLDDAARVKEETLEAAYEAATINDKLYAYPMTADNGYFLYYNKKYIKDSDVETMDSLLQAAKKQSSHVSMDLGSGWYLYSFFANTGLKLKLNDDGITNSCNWNSKKGKVKGVDVANALLRIVNSGGLQSGGDDSLLAGAKAGSVVAGVSGVWLGDSLREIWGDNLGATKLPTYTVAGKQVQMGSYSGYKFVGVNAYSQNKEWATKLAQWLTNEENQTLRFEQRGLGPANANAADSSSVKNNVAIHALLEQSKYASLQRVGGKYWDPTSVFGNTIASGNATGKNLQHLLDEMVKGITALN